MIYVMNMCMSFINSNDPCRSSECLWDGGNCEPDGGWGCENGCSTLYTNWAALIGIDTWLVNHTYVCEHLWPVALVFLVNDENEYTENCTSTMILSDFNHDSHMNFKELGIAGGLITEPHLTFWLTMNCSACVDMENYNPSYYDY